MSGRSWINDFDVVNEDEPDPKKHFRLYTLFQDDGRVTCSPDAAFLLNHDGRQMVLYAELERGRTGAKQLVGRKAPGYRLLAERGLHKVHFPGTTADDFHVLLFAPTPRRREAIRRAFRASGPAEQGADLWRFVALAAVSPETFLEGEILYGHREELPSSIVRL